MLGLTMEQACTESRKQLAISHYCRMDELYSNEINETAVSVIHNNDCCDCHINTDRKPEIVFDDMTTVEAIGKYYESNKEMAILNFASYKHPGGGYMAGMMAQEEQLCHFSTMYNILDKCEEFYASNRKRLNFGVYETIGLYFKCRFIWNGRNDIVVNVISMAAPNYGVVSLYRPEKIDLAMTEMKNRVSAVIHKAAVENIDTLVLGAWGCGVFKWPPEIVANMFKDSISNNPKSGNINRIVFAIPKGKHYNVFKNVLGGNNDDKTRRSTR